MRSGKTIYFRFANEYDAEFILSLRNNNKLNMHLSKTSSNVLAQKKWLLNYKNREKINKEYYFIICRSSDDLSIGTVRLYDFIEEQNSFCWGSWILNANKTRTSAVESALLVYDFAFNNKKFKNSHFDVRKDNQSVNKFHSKMGAYKVGETEVDYLYQYTKEKYFEFYDKNKKYIEK